MSEDGSKDILVKMKKLTFEDEREKEADDLKSDDGFVWGGKILKEEKLGEMRMKWNAAQYRYILSGEMPEKIANINADINQPNLPYWTKSMTGIRTILILESNPNPSSLTSVYLLGTTSVTGVLDTRELHTSFICLPFAFSFGKRRNVV